MAKIVFKLLFIAIDVILLMSNANPIDITQRRLTNLKNADIVGISRKLPIGMGSSLAWEESRGYETAVGPNNTDIFCSFGLCQINEKFEEELANKYLPGGYAIYDRFNPDHSSIIGTSYLFDLHKQFGNWKEALCAYNWGPNNVKKCKSYSDIPFKVREYARRVLSRIVVKEHDYLQDIKKESSYKKLITNYTRIQECTDIKKYLLLKNINNFINNNVSAKKTRNSKQNFI
jgi:hypothetical protein